MYFNNLLNDNIFYEGSLIHDLDLSPHASKTISLKLYTNEEIHTTLMVVDNNSQIAYMAPLSKSYHLTN